MVHGRVSSPVEHFKYDKKFFLEGSADEGLDKNESLDASTLKEDTRHTMDITKPSCVVHQPIAPTKYQYFK